MERMLESVERNERNPEMNLRTNYEETLKAMAMLEGPAWNDQQGEDGNTVGAALQRLEQGRHGRSVVYGAVTGHRRWYVAPDGAVSFSESHASPEDVQRARELGFEITP